MKLDIFKFVYNQGLASEWRLEECRLSQINLMVGKNASGKSRSVTAIYTLSKLLSESGSLPAQPKSYEWHLWFDNEQPEQKTEYLLKIEKGLVIQEKLIRDGDPLLDRDESGEGTIFAQELNQKMRFQTPKTELAVVKRRDLIQHPFLEKLYQWSNSLGFYEFGTRLGQDRIAQIPPKIELLKNATDLKDCDDVIRIFVLGEQEIGNQFIQ